MRREVRVDHRALSNKPHVCCCREFCDRGLPTANAENSDGAVVEQDDHIFHWATFVAPRIRIYTTTARDYTVGDDQRNFCQWRLYVVECVGVLLADIPNTVARDARVENRDCCIFNLAQQIRPCHRVVSRAPDGAVAHYQNRPFADPAGRD